MKLPNEAAQAKLDWWYKGTPYQILHFWSLPFGTFHVAVATKHNISFIRLFTIGDHYEISIDGTRHRVEITEL